MIKGGGDAGGGMLCGEGMVESEGDGGGRGSSGGGSSVKGWREEEQELTHLSLPLPMSLHVC